MQNIHKVICTKSRNICSVPQCSSYCTPDISLHKFPTDPKLRNQWKIILRIGKPLTKYMFVCSKHFLIEDFMPATSATIRKRLKKGVLPSQYIPVRKHDVTLKKMDRRRKKLLKSNIIDEDSDKENELSEEQEANIGIVPIVVPPLLEVTQNRNTQVTSNYQEDPDHPVDGNTSSFCEEKPTEIDSGSFPLSPILIDDEKLLHFTGINSKLLNIYTKCMQNICVQNSVGNENLRLYITLVLCKLKTNLSFVCLAVLFGMNVTTCKRAFYKYVSLLALSIKPAIYWPTRDEIQKNLPKCFDKFKGTRVILDATEIKVQKLKCLQCRILSYSNYKCCHTIKFLIGITPSGLISYVSKAYGGRCSDKAIFCNENIIDKLDPYDAVMVDKGILIEKECEQRYIKLIRPPFLKNKKQLSKEDAVTTANIARARVHVERAIQRIKLFAVLNQQIDWYLIPHIEDVMTIAAATVNMSAPILADDKLNLHIATRAQDKCFSCFLFRI